MDKVEEILEEIQKDNTTLVITIIVGLIICIVFSLTCVAICNFVCNKDEDFEEDIDENVNRRRSSAKKLNDEESISKDKNPSKVVDKFSVEAEKELIVANIKRKLRTQLYQQELESPLSDYKSYDSRQGFMRPSVVSNSASPSPIGNLCSICNQPFRLGEQKFTTSCKHHFHQQCLLKSINQQVEQALRAMHAQTVQGQKVDLSKCSAKCPTCGFQLDQAPPVEEQMAISHIGGILNMLSMDGEDGAPFDPAEAAAPAQPVDPAAVAINYDGSNNNLAENNNNNNNKPAVYQESMVFESARVVAVSGGSGNGGGISGGRKEA